MFGTRDCLTCTTFMTRHLFSNIILVMQFLHLWLWPQYPYPNGFIFEIIMLIYYFGDCNASKANELLLHSDCSK